MTKGIGEFQNLLQCISYWTFPKLYCNRYNHAIYYSYSLFTSADWDCLFFVDLYLEHCRLGLYTSQKLRRANDTVFGVCFKNELPLSDDFICCSTRLGLFLSVLQKTWFILYSVPHHNSLMISRFSWKRLRHFIPFHTPTSVLPTQCPRNRLLRSKIPCKHTFIMYCFYCLSMLISRK